MVALIFAPVALPLLDPPILRPIWTRRACVRRQTKRPPSARLSPRCSRTRRWRDLERRVAAIYRTLSEDKQRRVTIIGSNYGEAAAIDVYGRADRLPAAVSGQNQYYLWGPGPGDGSVTIHVNGDPERWRRLCRSLEIADTFGAPYAMPYETAGRSLYAVAFAQICRRSGRGSNVTSDTPLSP